MQEVDLSKSQSDAADKSSSSDGKSHESKIKRCHPPKMTDFTADAAGNDGIQL